MYQGMESRESNVQEPSAASLKVSMSSHVMLPVYGGNLVLAILGGSGLTSIFSVAFQ